MRVQASPVFIVVGLWRSSSRSARLGRRPVSSVIPSPAQSGAASCSATFLINNDATASLCTNLYTKSHVQIVRCRRNYELSAGGALVIVSRGREGLSLRLIQQAIHRSGALFSPRRRDEWLQAIVPQTTVVVFSLASSRLIRKPLHLKGRAMPAAGWCEQNGLPGGGGKWCRCVFSAQQEQIPFRRQWRSPGAVFQASRAKRTG
jgi:hypothetical protein